MQTPLFGQLLKQEADKLAVIKTLERSGNSHGSRIHTNLTEAHNTILSRHVFYVAARKRTPSWWLVLCKSGPANLSVLVEPTKRPEFPYPRMYLWPGRWDPALYAGTVFAVQTHDVENPVLTLEDTMLCPTIGKLDAVTWSDSPFSARWKATQVIFHDLFKNDETINSTLTELRTYNALKDFKTVSMGVPYIEFMPEDAGRRRFLLPGRSMPTSSALLEPAPALPPAASTTVTKVVGGMDKYRKPTLLHYGVSKDTHPDVYILHRKSVSGKPEQMKQADGTPQYAAVQTLSTSRSLRIAFDAASTGEILVWKCRWIAPFSKWEPFELVGKWSEHGSSVAVS